MNHVKSPVVRFLPAILWMVIIFFVSHQPSAVIPKYGSWDTLLKKGGHVFAYAVLAILLQYAGLSSRWAFFLAVLYAISDELHQTQIAGRNGQPMDVAIDTVGIVIGVLLFHRLGALLRESGWGRRGMVDEQSPRDV